jgi:hypothetical protein
MTAPSRQKPDRQDATAEINRHDVHLHAIIAYDFIAHPRFRSEIEAAFRRGPMAVFELLDEIARAQDLTDAAAMLEGAAYCTPDTQRAVLRDVIALIEGVPAPETQAADRGDQAGQEGPTSALAPDLLRTISAIISAVRREGRGADADQELQTIERYVQHILLELEPGASCASDLRRDA